MSPRYRPCLGSSLSLPAQVSLEDKLGGLPWGLPLEKWPFCRICQKPMTLLLQWRHHPERLDLGCADGVLLVFQCDWRQIHTYIAEGSDEKSWINYETRVFVLSAAELGEGLTYPPEPGATVFPEARVQSWDRLDDSAVKAGTILGGTVEWLTESVEVPAGFKFLAQISTRLNFRGPLPDGVRQNNVSPWPRFHGRFDAPATGSGGKDSWSCCLLESWHSWSSGQGYLFLETKQSQGALLWQWTDVRSASAPQLSGFAGLGVTLTEQDLEKSLIMSQMFGFD